MYYYNIALALAFAEMYFESWFTEAMHRAREAVPGGTTCINLEVLNVFDHRHQRLGVRLGLGLRRGP